MIQETMPFLLSTIAGALLMWFLCKRFEWADKLWKALEQHSKFSPMLVWLCACAAVYLLLYGLSSLLSFTDMVRRIVTGAILGLVLAFMPGLYDDNDGLG